ncbi:MAG: cell filamentation protein Fic [Cytophagaceae bacterium]|nr:MAG: cell filamentation protein Fic [Cytophagaceae bacterium]
MGKYRTSAGESEILPNLLGLTQASEIGLAEFEGFLRAEILLSEVLQPTTRFTAGYVREVHRLALAHLYEFAGKYREVNLSKGGFTFPAARFLAASMQQFERDLLHPLPRAYASVEPLLDDVAAVHGELLFIHPFREGNGRTARLVANLMLEQHGYERPRWELITAAEFPRYVAAVQQSALGNYAPMRQLMRALYPG